MRSLRHGSRCPLNLVAASAQGRTQFLQKRECCAGALEGRFIATLAKLNNAKTVLEVGMFTGTTTLAVAQALPDDGKVRELTTLVSPTTWPG